MSEDDIEHCPLFVTLRITDRAVLERIIELYRNTNSEIEMISMSNPCVRGSQPVLLDLGAVTERQWEALEIAHAYGHYSGKRGGGLERIATDLGISKSAASQRLRAAESRIVSGLLGTGRLACESSTELQETVEAMAEPLEK